MHTRLVVVTQLQHAEAVLQKIREMYEPEMMGVWVREERITSALPLEAQVKEGSDAHDYLDSPLCRIEVGLHRTHEERDDRFLTQLSWEFKIINSFWSALLGADLESSLETQQRYWKILEYKVIDEGTCTWVAKARRVYSLDGPEEEARVRVLLVRDFKALSWMKAWLNSSFTPEYISYSHKHYISTLILGVEWSGGSFQATHHRRVPYVLSRY